MNSHHEHAWKRIALLGIASALAGSTVMGCAVAGESDAASDSLPRQRGVMRVQGDTPSPVESSGEEPSGGEPIGEAEQAINTGHGMNYYGGAVMTNPVHVYYIRYGSWTSSSAFTILENFANDIGGSPYYNINTLYDNSSGNQVLNNVTYEGYTSDSYSYGTNLSTSNVWSVVTSAFSSGRLPVDADGVYFVLGSSDVDQYTSDGSSFCNDFCGWHTYGTYNNTKIKFSFVGDASSCPTSCIPSSNRSSSPNGNPAMDGMVSVIAHELEEATTDPELSAWADSSGDENADKCAWTFGTTFSSSNGATANMMLRGHEYLIQQNWINSGSGSCGLTYGQLSEHGGTGGSRFDTGCAANEAAVGLIGRSGSLVDKVGLYCAALDTSGNPSTTTYTTTQYGGTGGSAFSTLCPTGMIMVGIYGRSGSKVDQIGIKCSYPSTWASSGTVQYTATAGGGSGGTAFSDTCSQGHVLNRITGRSGSLVDRAQGGCAMIWQ